MTENTDQSPVWGKRLTAPPNELNIRFCGGRDLSVSAAADEELLEYDIWTNLAHSAMLHKVKVLNDLEYQELKKALRELPGEFEKGVFKLDPRKEDVHINIEHYITRTKGLEAGKKLHTGRSRNDQVAADVRLYTRDKALTLIDNLLTLVEAILIKAKAGLNIPMPGFTHYQPAMLTTAAHWLTSWSQAILRDCFALWRGMETLNLSPLGAAASFGTSWPIDRELAAELLGFDGVEENTLDCITNRGEQEARVAANISVLMNHLSIVAQDIILLSHPYFGMMKIDDAFVTGSSIMPQKRNPDFAELTRSKTAVAHGLLNAVLGISKGLMSGYNRDTQQTKYLIMDLWRECEDIPTILKGVIESLTFNPDKMAACCEMGFINGAEVADWLAQNFGLPFRDCYDVISIAVKYSDELGKLTRDTLQKAIREKGFDIRLSEEEVAFLDSPQAIIDRKLHTGAPSAAAVEKMIKAQRDKVRAIQDNSLKIKRKIDSAKIKCFES